MENPIDDRGTSGAQPGESPKERADRELGELLGEIRVALPGVEILLGFLLILPFNDRFAGLGDVPRGAYLVSLVVTSMAIGLFVAPTAHHRLGFRSIDKEQLLMRSNRQVLGALACVALAISLAAFVVGSVVLDERRAYVIAAGIGVWLITWWFLVPQVSNRRARRRRERR